MKFANGKVYINGIEGFWSFAKKRLMKYHGVDPGKFPLYLKKRSSGILPEQRSIRYAEVSVENMILGGSYWGIT